MRLLASLCLRRRVRLALAAVLVTVAMAGCRRPRVDGTVASDTVLKAWDANGFDAKTVENVDPSVWQAGACSRGQVVGLDVLLCEYVADEVLSAGEQTIMASWQQEKVPTGAVVRRSRTLLAISDPNGVDPSGRTIVRLIGIFRAQN